MTLRQIARAAIFLAALLAGDCAHGADRLRVGDLSCLCGGAFVIARDQGYFQKLGLEIQSTRFEDGASVLSAVAAGELDIAMIPLQASMFNAVAAGAPLAIILDAGSNRRGFGATVINIAQAPYEDGLRSVSDFTQLKGRKFAVPALGGIHHYNAALALRKVNLIPATDVQWIANASQPQIVHMLAENEVAAADLAYEFGFIGQSNRSAPIIVTDDQLVPGAAVSAFAVRREVLARRRDAVVRFAMAYLRASRDFNAAARDPSAHPDVVDILARGFPPRTPDLLRDTAPNWSYMAEDGLPQVNSIMDMQEFWGGKYFTLVQHKASRQQLFDLTLAKDAKARLDKEKPFGK